MGIIYKNGIAYGNQPNGTVPSGGTTGQVLKKASNTDYDTEWANESGGGGGTSDIAEEYDPISGVYSVGDYCIYQTVLYKCITAISTPEAFDSTKWAEVTVGDEISDVRNTLNHKADVIYDTASGDIASFPDGADGLPVKDLTVGIEPVQSGTGDPSPTNVRPISGWTGANVTRTGKNLIVCDNSTPSSSARVLNTHGAKLFKGQTYTLSIKKTSLIYNRIYIFILDSATTQQTSSSLGTPTYMWTTYDTSLSSAYTFVSDSDKYLYLWIGDVVGSFSISELQMELGSVATSYESFVSTTIPISWQSSAGTVYGGTLDLTSGVLTVTDANIASYNGETLPGEWISDRDVYAAGTTPTTGAQVVYKLATPTTYQLTPTEVTTLLGQNNIWANCGPSTVEYPCDTKLYIQKINTPTDDDMIADANIASGQYFIVNNNLYLSTAAILAGDPIKPGTNCILTNLAAALNAINT